MSKKSILALKISKFLLAAAPALLLGGIICTNFAGEPSAPKSLLTK